MSSDATVAPFAFTVAPGEGPQRMDHVLATRLPAHSRARLQQLVRDGHATVDGRVVRRPAAKVGAGSRIEIRVPAPSELDADLRPAPQIDFGLRYEDADILVVDKPAGLVVHPAVGHADDTLVNAIVARFPGIATTFSESSSAHRPGIVHRLDRDTSGVMVVARTPDAAAALIEQFKSRAVRKVYLAIARGVPSPPAGVIDAPVGRDPLHRQRMRAMPDGRPARTTYRVLDAVAGYSLLELRPETGRTHQIRVHLKAVGHPIVADPIYGRSDAHIDRLALHAWHLSFTHPRMGRALSFDAPLPSDLQRAMTALGLDHDALAGTNATPR